MKTLKEIVEDLHVRKGKSNGVTKRGAFWLACDEIMLRRSGGDGIGQNSPDVTHYLQIRHYRDGAVRPVIRRHAWHQNGTYSGSGDNFTAVAEIVEATTVEQIAAILMGYSAHNPGHDGLMTALAALGMPAAEPAPDGE